MVDPEIVAIETRAKAANLRMSGILRDAGVAESTWFRWREKGVEPRLPTLRRVQGALEKRIKSRHAPN